MTQTEIALLMNTLGRGNAQFDPIVSITFWADFLERAYAALGKPDYKSLLYAGACISKLVEAGHP